MAEQSYVVFFHPTALDALGDAIKPYLTDGPSGVHIQCTEIDTGGAFCEMKVQTKSAADKLVEVELMIPVAMIRLIISTEGEHEFGFT